MSPIDLAIFLSRVESICAEMGAILQRAAFSPNIKDRLDFSCALFDRHGELFAQAAHIPVHLGSMAYAMAEIVDGVEWNPGDMLVLNDPFLGGTHLPDVTIIAPLFVDRTENRMILRKSVQKSGQKSGQKGEQLLELICFVANRAHHANIGADAPGSMPLSNTLEQEGIVIPPTMFIRAGKKDAKVLSNITGLPGADTSGDFAAQISANEKGLERLGRLTNSMGLSRFYGGIDAINEYGEKIARHALRKIPRGSYRFSDMMDDDGFGHRDIEIRVVLTVGSGGVEVDFSGTSMQVEGNINCPVSVAAAAVFYAFRCLLPQHAPNCAGTFRSIVLKAPSGCLVNARRPCATAAGNVETSMRIVDVVLGALWQAVPLDIPAASQGTMNNVAMGSRASNTPWDYYETIAGGMGAGVRSTGLSGVQCHMTNTLNTPIESLESHYPLRILSYALRRGSAGKGEYAGGNGLVREFQFLEPAEVTLLTERRRYAPWGLSGGGSGAPGKNTLDGKPVAGKCYFHVEAGQVLKIETPGGGGYGPEPEV